MLHMDGLARFHERAVEDCVEDVAALRPAIGEVEIIWADAVAPVGKREAEIALRARADHQGVARTEEHTSELQSLMRTSYAVFCFKKQIYQNHAAYNHI